MTFAGRRADVPDVLRCLDVLVNASDAEPFGRSVLEAQASGVAVVGTDAGGIPEFVDSDVTGLLVPPGVPAALRAALARVLADAEPAGAAGRRRAPAGRGALRPGDPVRPGGRHVPAARAIGRGEWRQRVGIPTMAPMSAADESP